MKEKTSNCPLIQGGQGRSAKEIADAASAVYLCCKILFLFIIIAAIWKYINLF